jgi:hypothetical protein
MPARKLQTLSAHTADRKSHPTRRSKPSSASSAKSSAPSAFQAFPDDRRLNTDGSPRRAKLVKNLQAAAAAARCQHIRLNGQRCAAPARSGSDFCIFHGYEYEGRVPVTVVPEDAASVTLELGRVIRQLQDGNIQPKSAALILYALQIASMNLKRLHNELVFEPPVSAANDHMQAILDELKRVLAEEHPAPSASSAETSADSAFQALKKEPDSTPLASQKFEAGK